jgi:hypothetical protein
MAQDKKKNLTIRLLDNVRLPAAAAAAALDSTLQAVVEQFLREFGSGGRTIVLPPPSEPTFPAKYEKDVDSLIWILEHGTPSDRTTIRGILKTSAEAVRSRPPSRKQHSR